MQTAFKGDNPIKIVLKDRSLEDKHGDNNQLIVEFLDEDICNQFKAALMKARWSRWPKSANSKVLSQF